MVRWCVRLAAVLVLSLGAQASAQDTSNEDAAYRRLVDEAVREFSAGRWEEARALFQRAHALSPSARTLRGLGMTAFELRRYVQAMRELEAALREPRKPLDAELAAHVRELIGKARAFVGRVEPRVEPAEARLLVDGRAPEREPDGAILLDTGMHVLSATLDGYKPTNVRVHVEGGSHQIVRVLLEPLPATLAKRADTVQVAEPPAKASPPAPAPPRHEPAASDSSLETLAWIALAGAGAFGVTAGVLYYGVGDSQYADLEAKCGKTGCSERQIADSGIETTDALTNVFLGLSVVSGLASGVLFALDASRSGEHDALALEVAPLAVRLEGSF